MKWVQLQTTKGYLPDVTINILVGRSVEAMQLIIKITKELHGQDVPFSLLELFPQMGNVKVTTMVILVFLDPQASGCCLI